jgi:Domain of unknown function (DUF932)
MEPIIVGSTKILRNPELDSLSDRQLKAFSPTIFAKGGIQGVADVKDVSDGYGFVSTISVINALRDSGFEPVEVRQSQRRNEAKMPWTKHMIKFRQTGLLKKVQRGDVVPQVILLNSHDRSSGFHMYAGLFRLVCSNGLMVSEGEAVEPIKIMHTKRLAENVISQAQELVRGADGVFRLRSDMLATILTDKQQIAFATKALEVRPPRAAAPLPVSLLEARRPQDNKPDLWHVYNRVQENMLRGGLNTVTPEGRAVASRGIGRIERDVEVNAGLWALAVQAIAKAKTSAAKKTGAKKAVETADELL